MEVTKLLVDCNGTLLRKGDVIHYKTKDSFRFEYVGIIHEANYDDDGFITVLTRTRMVLEKYPRNVKKMLDTEAMLWKLENS